MSREVWIARDGHGELFLFSEEPVYDVGDRVFSLASGDWEELDSSTYRFIGRGECVRFVAAERFVNGEPVSDGETIPVRIAVVANQKREWNAAGWLTDNSPPSDATLFGLAKTLLGCDNLSRTIVVTRVPVPRVAEVQGVVEGTVPNAGT